jgi:probable rRNA maturation factor
VTVLLAGPEAREGLPVVDRRLLRSRAIRVLRALSHSRSELSIALVDDATIARLNERYRGVARPTDVLAFPIREGEAADRGGNLLGDVVISVETAKRQAQRSRRGFDAELARLLVHGTLHLLGHDHQDDAEARRMRAEELRLLRVLRE